MNHFIFLAIASAAAGWFLPIVALPAYVAAGVFALLGFNVIRLPRVRLPAGAEKKVGGLVERLESKLLAKLESKWTKSEDPAIRGDLDAMREARWPKAQWPELWARVPADVWRQPRLDGRLLDGADKIELVPNLISEDLVRDAVRKSIRSTIVMSLVFVFLAIAISAGVRIYLGAQMGGFGDAAKSAAPQIQNFSQLGNVDFWTKAEIDAAVAAKKSSYADDAKLAVYKANAARSAILALPPYGILTAIFAALALGFASVPGKVWGSIESESQPLRKETKEETVRFKWRRADHKVRRRAYRAQVRNAKTFFKDSPLIYLGTASGLARARGSLTAPHPDQVIVTSLDDLSQGGMMLFGGTGEGKSRFVLEPLADQIFDIQKNYAGFKMGFVGMDGKAVLRHPLEKMAKAHGLEVRVIGAKPEEGEYGVDLFGRLPPAIIGDMIAQAVALAAKGSGQNGDFWGQMSEEVCQRFAVLARAYEATDEGVAEAKVSGDRAYSIIRILAMSQDVGADGMIGKMTAAVIRTLEQSPEHLSDFIDDDLFDAIDYLRGGWLSMADATRTGLQAHMMSLFGRFASVPVMRRAFGAASNDRMMAIEDVFLPGMVTLTNLSNIDYGKAANLAQVFITTRIYYEARQRELRDPAIGYKEKLFFMKDEYHSLATFGNQGMSDLEFTSINRSAGIIFAFATQSVDTLMAAAGEQKNGTKVQALLNNLRGAKIFMRTDDRDDTVAMARALAGKALRAYVFNSGDHESLDMMAYETGKDPFDLKPVREVVDNRVASESSVMKKLDLFDVSRQREAFQKAGSVDMFNPQAATQALAEAKSWLWRAEDQRQKMLSEGNVEAEIVSHQDFTEMGRAHAFILWQRAGAGFYDFVQIGDDKEDKEAA